MIFTHSSKGALLVLKERGTFITFIAFCKYANKNHCLYKAKTPLYSILKQI